MDYLFFFLGYIGYMKNKKIILLIFVIAVCSWWGEQSLASAYVKIQKISEWGSSNYEFIKVHGNYAYCASPWTGVDIFDIRNPADARQVAAYDPPDSYVGGLEIDGNYLYIAAFFGVQIVDITNPPAPVLLSFYPHNCYGLTRSGHYLYLLGEDEILQVLDISNPYAPAPAGSLSGYRFTPNMKAVGNYLYAISFDGYFLVVDVSDPWNPMVTGILENKNYNNLCISGAYAYVSKNQGMAVVDISNPAAPKEIARYEPYDYIYGQNITVQDPYVFMGFKTSWLFTKVGMEIIDISNPQSPQQAGRISVSAFQEWEEKFALDTSGSYLYAAGYGLRVYDISNPGAPRQVGDKVGNGYWNRAFAVSGNYAYISKDNKGIYTLDISDPTSPKTISIYHINTVQCIFRSGQYLYVAGYHDGLFILDISNPAEPKKIYELKKANPVLHLYVKDQYLYLLIENYGIEIYDISKPFSPQKVGGLQLAAEETSWAWGQAITIAGDYAYCAYTSNYLDKFLVIDISDAANPVKVSQGIGSGVNIKGNFLFAPEGNNLGKIHVYDISNPAAPREIAAYEMQHGSAMAFYGKYAYIESLFNGFHVLDISNPAVFSLKGSYSGPFLRGLLSSGDYIYALADSKFLEYKASLSNRAPRLVLDTTKLYFGVDAAGVPSPPQKVRITNGGGANLNWEATPSDDFITARPFSSSTANELYIGIDPTGLGPGKHKGTVTLTDYVATNSPRTIDVIITVYPEGQTKPPFGHFATPANNSTVQGSIPVTGWTLDDIGVKSVKICREAGDNLVLIGEATFVEGARPDVESEYPEYPMNYSAGWGYMMLSNFLPGGDGTYVLHAIAVDMEGNYADLGKKTIFVKNNTTLKPFGTIDTPVQDGVTAGTAFPNFAWALTPQPKTIPFDGSTIDVYVDGQRLGKPVYNLLRPDVRTLFPGYGNSEGAGGYFLLDTTKFTNGIHTIQWVVKDDQGKQDGIGSRYFKISNTDDTYTLPQNRGSSFASILTSADLDRIPADNTSLLTIKKGLDPDQGVNRVSADVNGYYHTVIRELDNLEICFTGGVRVNGCMKAGSRLVNLPLGSSFNREQNIFYWQAGPGYYGEYRLIFFQEDENGNISRKNVMVTILPK